MDGPGMDGPNQRRRLARLLLALAALAAFAGCADEAANALGGSLTGRLDLGFDRVRVLRIGADLSIEYVRDSGGGVLIPFKLVAEGVGPETRDVATGALSVGRVMGAGEPSALPPLEYGALAIDDPVAVGATLSGAFDLRFTDGSDLSGRFEATVEGP